MTLGAPHLLLALVAVPFLVVGYLLLERRRAKRSSAWTRETMLPNTTRRPARRSRHIPAVLLLLGLSLALVGVARPERILDTVSGNAPTIVLTVDVSGSMAASDVKPSRISAARAVALRTLQQLPRKYRVAVVTFGDKVRLAVAPTFDRRRVIAGLPRRSTALAGTAIGIAASESVAVVTQSSRSGGPGKQSQPGAVLLISDGAQTSGGTSLADAGLTARVSDVPISTVPIGTSAGIVAQTTVINHLRTATQIPVPVDPAALRMLARQSGGTFFAGGSAVRPATLYAGLRSSSTHGTRKHELTAAVGAGALAFVLAGLVLSGLWFGRIT